MRSANSYEPSGGGEQVADPAVAPAPVPAQVRGNPNPFAPATFLHKAGATPMTLAAGSGSAVGKSLVQAVRLDPVVVPDDKARDAEFILTRNPSCSSLPESDLKYQAYAKLRPQTTAKLERNGHDRGKLMTKLRKRSTAVEAFYLREIARADRHADDKSLWYIASAFAHSTGLHAHRSNLAQSYEGALGTDVAQRLMVRAPLEAIASAVA